MKLNVQFNARQTELIADLASELGVTKSRVLCLALGFLEVANRERAAGNRVAVVRDGRVVKEIVL